MTEGSPERPTRLLFIRHGESEVTVRGVIGGEGSCTGLSELGQQQASRLHDRFAAGGETAVSLAYASTLPRAIETAEIVLPALDGVELRIEEDLEELRPGSSDGMRFTDIHATYAPLPGDEDPFRPFAPGAESRGAFHHRVGSMVHELIRRHPGECLALFCHGGVVDVAMRLALGSGLRIGFDLWTYNTSITELQLTPPHEGRPPRWRIVRYNDAAHLAGLPTETPRS